MKESRDVVRSRLVEVASRLLATEGAGAVTTRSVALAAGVQAPTIYRLFGDKDALLDAVAEQGFVDYLAHKPPISADDDPVAGLKAGWDLHVGFGVAHPSLFRLMHTTEPTPQGQTAIEAGMAVLRQRVRRVAAAGRLCVSERRAVDLIHSAGTGVVFALIDRPTDQTSEQPSVGQYRDGQRDEQQAGTTAAPDTVQEAGRGADRVRDRQMPFHGAPTDRADGSLADLAWDAVCSVVLTDAPSTGSAGPATAAVTLLAAIPELTMLTPHERALLGDWLERIAGPVPATQPDMRWMP